MTILVTGATGQVGGAAVRALIARGQKIRVLARDPARATGFGSIEIVKGSFEDDASLTRALDGVQAVLLTGRDSPDTVALQSNVLKNIWKSDVRHVVNMSLRITFRHPTSKRWSAAAQPVLPRSWKTTVIPFWGIDHRLASQHASNAGRLVHGRTLQKQRRVVPQYLFPQSI